MYNFRSLYWYEESSHPGLGSLMTAKMDGSNLRNFFNDSKKTTGASNDCNCPENPQVAKSFIIDMTSSFQELYWVDPWVHQILASDMNGCKCRIVVDATEKKKYGFTPMSITVDSKYVYWFNSTEKEIFYAIKNKKHKPEHAKTSHGYKIMALDAANQPYPPRQCLFPKPQNLLPKVISNSANSITLQMPTVNKSQHCRNLEFEMTATEYTIFYRLQTTGDNTPCDRDSCPHVVTTGTEVILYDLKSFTNYTVMLEATNYYAKLHEIKPLVGAPLVLQTAAEGIYIYHFIPRLI